MTGFLIVIVIVALLAVVGMKVVPTVVEYVAIKKAIVNAKNNASTVREIQVSFDKQRDAGYIESVQGSDLEITRTENGFEVSIEYQKQIPLAGPVSLLIDYAASTSNSQ